MLSKVWAYIELIRPAQWVKNVFVFAALGFSEERYDPQSFLTAIVAFISFSLLSSSVYAFNDMRDAREDALHPTKRKRPVPSGRVSPGEAGIIAVLLAIAGVGLAWPLPRGFLLTAVTYLALNLFYTLGAKRLVLLDIILIAIGFVLRALGGAAAIEVDVSAWLIICTFTLCLFLGFGKRRCELAMLDAPGQAASYRATLALYTPDLLNQLLAVTGGIAVITFLLYTLDPHTTTTFRPLIFTTPLVFYAIFRYAMLIETGRHPGPTDILISDRPFLVTAVLWLVLTAVIVYRGKDVERYLPKLRWPGTPPAVKTAMSPRKTEASPTGATNATP